MRNEIRREALTASAPVLLGVVLAAGVCYPFVGGRLLLLDFVSGPHQPLLPVEAFGLDGGLTGGVPFALGCHLIDAVLGQAGTAVPAIIFFPLATTGLSRLLRATALPARLAAGLFYAVNPFVFDRLYAGQLGVLLGYALLPFAVDALMNTAERPRWGARAACWSAATVAMSVHFVWILVPVVAGAAATRSRRVPAALRLAGAALGAAAISSYLLVAPVLVGTSPAGALSQLASYRTQADPQLGLLANVAGLYGFFRPGPTEPKNLLSGWVAVLAALLLVSAVGYAAVLRDQAHRRDGLAILAAGMAGYFLALGDQGPTGTLFLLAYEHVPGFVVMREPDKFASLTALAYAYGFGQGISWLIARSRGKGARIATVALAGVLPLSYTPNLMGGLGGQVKASTFPSSWSVAGRIAGSGTVLFLPWRQYFPTSFTDQREITNPAPQYFAGTVLASQDPGPGYAFAADDPEHVFLDQVIDSAADPQRTRTALAGLGVKFIALAKVAGWQAYADLIDAPGIREVYSSPEIDLYSVSPTTEETTDDQRIRRLDAVDYQVLPGQPGVVALPVPYAPGWELDGQQAVQLADGQVGVRAPAGGGIAHYGPSRGVIASDVGSVVAALAVIILALMERRKRRPFGRPRLDAFTRTSPPVPAERFAERFE
jgi:hypothetical protein